MCPTDFELFSEVDEDGFVALVCPDAYAGYVGEDWTLEQVIERFLAQMNAQVLFVAHLGPDFANGRLRISNRPTPLATQREASGLLRVEDDGLWLTDYTQLTMAAQFDNERAIARYHTQLPIPGGAYRVTLRQFLSSPTVELVIQEAEGHEHPFSFEAVPWL
ncbi:hypothetical protein RAS12_04770 [Achromobacter seleniivolatilans]|uniref:Uncharacterized protein n=1 Tax=Achromobacter seleniivolatilans TaxID=3047478 RepID=A0ABY9M4Y8_9BURK|nr:hypothetical protein [Achromobacter sp. R39]WMD21693.1 hypothetical protein RAS12_04770 [Achromobacter sp. R39]